MYLGNEKSLLHDSVMSWRAGTKEEPYSSFSSLLDHQQLDLFLKLRPRTALAYVSMAHRFLLLLPRDRVGG